VRATLSVLARRARVTDLDALAAMLLPEAHRVAWADVERL
jgi:hypothetical protein